MLHNMMLLLVVVVHHLECSPVLHQTRPEERRGSEVKEEKETQEVTVFIISHMKSV